MKYKDFEYRLLDDGTVEITNYKTYPYFTTPLKIEIPSKIDGYTVTSIGDSAFSGCHLLKRIIIPDTITHIGYGAFSFTAYYNNNSNWKQGVLYIGNYLINGYEASGDYSIKQGTKVIADSAFSGCISLTNVTIPDSVTSIGSRAFSCCTPLKSVTVPNSVKTIGEDAFLGCLKLKSKKLKLKKNKNKK